MTAVARSAANNDGARESMRKLVMPDASVACRLTDGEHHVQRHDRQSRCNPCNIVSDTAAKHLFPLIIYRSTRELHPTAFMANVVGLTPAAECVCPN